MSKINYLLMTCFLLVIGYLITSQLRLATQSASQLLPAGIVKKIEIQITKAYRLLKRFPGSDDEFETLVLDRLNFSRYPQRVMVKNFKPGSNIAPAVFQVIIKEKTATLPVTFWLEYYGSDFHANPLYKGKLLKR